MTFFVSVLSETAWRMGRRNLAEALKRRWPELEEGEEDREGAPEELFWASPDGLVGGMLFRGGRAASVTAGRFEECARLALWFRGLVPDE